MWLLVCFLLLVSFELLLLVLAKHFRGWRKVYVVVAVIAMTGYILWRLIFTLNFSSVAAGIFSVLLFLAELLGAVVALFSITLFFGSLPSSKNASIYNAGFRPSVDILISTYNEPYKLVVSSALAAASLSYVNKKVYICDDGNRKLLKMAADTLGLGYITREDNKGAKAGNINHALSLTNSEFVLLLDADFIVKPYLLAEAIPRFKDETVAMVQFPQSFYNKDPFQLLSEKFFNEQDFFMRYMEPRLAQQNAMVHIGTNAVIRRSALAEIGGIPTASITEDMATGVLLQNAGYKTQYINKAYALGLAPFNLRDLKAQRQRWARGTLQVFKRIRPLRLPGLNARQKTIYTELLLNWFTSFQKMVFILIPTVFMVFGVPVARVDIPQFLLIVVPVLLLFFMSFSVVIGRVRSYTNSHVYDTLMAPFHSSAILRELFRPVRSFHVTPKEAVTQEKTDYRVVMPHILMSVWLLVALGFTAYKLIQGIAVFPLLVCAGWTLYNLYALFYSILTAKPGKAETAGDALSVAINETILCNGQQLDAFQMSFDGFLCRTPKGKYPPFAKDVLYQFEVPRVTLTSTVQFKGLRNGSLEFAFESTGREEAFWLSRYYVGKIHAAHELDFDRETVIDLRPKNQ